MTASAALLRRKAAEVIRRLCLIPVYESVTEWAAQYRILPETSTSPGPYDPSIVPYARRPQDLLADPSVSLLVLCWGSQLTKSTCLENGIGYRIHRMPAPIVIVQPKIDAAEAWAKERFVPMVLATRVLRDRVRLGRSSGSTLRYVRFPGGFVFAASAQSATELAARSSSFVLCDEVDRFIAIPGEGNPVEIVARRQGAAEVGQLALTSTPRETESSIILPYLEGGTNERYQVPCPHCGEYQALVWRDAVNESDDGLDATGLAARATFRLVWDKGKPETAQYLCAHCACLIDESYKREMMALGKWVATRPDASYPSFHLNSLYSPFAKSNWASLAREFEGAMGRPANLQVFVNTRLAEGWRETAEVVDANSLVARANEEFQEGIVPAGAGVLTVGTDVQANRVEVWVWAWGAGLESWPVAHVIIPGDPQLEPDDPDKPSTLWAALDELLAKEWPLAVGGTLPVSVAMIDSGYAHTQVLRFCKKRRARRIYPIKGQGGAGVPLLGKPTLWGKDKTIGYTIGTDQAKNQFIRSQLATREAGPGFVHLPDWLSTEQLEQFVSEKRKRRIHKGQIVWEWQLKREDLRNEALDCRNYARAALEMTPWLGTKVIARLGAIAEELRLAGEKIREAVGNPAEGSAPDPAAAEASPPSPHRPGGWMGRMRGR